MRTILEVVVGSTLHGTNVEDGLEDLDLMAIVVEDLSNIVGFNPKDTWVHRTKPEGVRSEAGDTDLTIYGLRKFLSLALKGNLTILLAFFATSPFVRHRDMFGYTLQSLYKRVVSKQVFQPFRGYMRQQHERLLGLRGQRNITRPELVEAHGYDTKYAAHIIRLGLQGEEILLTGRLSLPMQEEQRKFVRGIRTGSCTLAEVSTHIVDAENRIVKAFEKTQLPEKPDYAFMEDWMLGAYRYHWDNPDDVPQDM